MQHFKPVFPDPVPGGTPFLHLHQKMHTSPQYSRWKTVWEMGGDGTVYKTNAFGVRHQCVPEQDT